MKGEWTGAEGDAPSVRLAPRGVLVVVGGHLPHAVAFQPVGAFVAVGLEAGIGLRAHAHAVADSAAGSSVPTERSPRACGDVVDGPT